MSHNSYILDKKTNISSPLSTANNTVSSPCVIIIEAGREEIQSIRKDNLSLIIIFTSGETIIIKHYFTDNSYTSNNDLVIRTPQDKSFLVAVSSESEQSIVFTELNSVDPLITHESFDLSNVAWILGGVALGGLVIANHGKGHSGNGHHTGDTTAPTAPAEVTVTSDDHGRATISGNAEAGSTVEITLPDGKTVPVTADKDGHFSYTTTDPQPKGDISVVAKDATGNTSAATVTPFAGDTTPPMAPTINVKTTVDGYAQISGDAEPNSFVIINLTDQTDIRIMADKNGHYSGISKQQIPEGTISAVSTDIAGNKSKESTANYNGVNTDDHTPPAPPTIYLKTNTEGLLVISGKAEPTSTITITMPDKTQVTVTANSAGEFSSTSTTPQPNGKIITTARDISGNTSEVVETNFTSKEQNNKINIETYIDSVENQTGEFTVDIPTNDRNPIIRGRLENATTENYIFLFSVDSKGEEHYLTTTKSKSGKWEVKLEIAGPDDEYKYIAKISDESNQLISSSEKTITLDTLSPTKPQITSYTETQQTSSKNNVINEGTHIYNTTDNTLTLHGIAEKNSTISIYDIVDKATTKIGTAKTNDSGRWEYNTNFLVNRQHEFTIDSTDSAGNISKISDTTSIFVNGPVEEPKNIGEKNVWSTSRSGDINGDGYDDLLASPYSLSYIDILLGPDLTKPVYLGGATNSYAYHQAGLGDINGDGLKDLGIMFGNTTGTTYGNLDIYLGGTTATLSPAIKIPSGYSIGAAGDLNGDGLSDFVKVGYGGNGSTQKSVIHYGNQDAKKMPVSPELNFGITTYTDNKSGTDHAANYSGSQIVDAIGDFNGDGIGDMVTAAGIYFGNPNGVSVSPDRKWITDNNSRATNLVQAVSAAGDVNGDGYADVVVNDGMRPYVIFGGTSKGPIELTESNMLSGSGFLINTHLAANQLTSLSAVAGLGDVNGDGLSDIAFSTYGNPSKLDNKSTSPVKETTYTNNNSYIIFGKTDSNSINIPAEDPSNGITGSKVMLASQGIVILEDQADGSSINGMSDYNGDGLADVFISSYSLIGKLLSGGASLGAEPTVVVDAGGTATGNDRSNFIVGTSHSDTLIGNGGKDIIYAGSGDDRIVINTGNIISLAEGYDSSLGFNGRISRIDGGNGIDTLAFDKDVVNVDLTSISNSGIGFTSTGIGMSRISNIEAIDLKNGAPTKLTLSLLDVMDMSSTTNTYNSKNFDKSLDNIISRHQLLIDGEKGDELVITDADKWINKPSMQVSHNGHNYDIYNTLGNHQGQLIVDQLINVTFQNLNG